jgi:hypothetical protein
MTRSVNGDPEIRMGLDAYIRKIQRRAERLGYANRRQLFRYDRYRDSLMAKIAGREDDPV